jgi:anti-sigma factor (TIGR02949 family)
MNWVDELRRVLDRLRGQPPAEGAGMEGGVSCQEAADHLYEWLDGELDPEMARRVGTHLEVCARCYPVLVFERSFRDAVARVAREEEAPPALKRRVLRELEGEGYGVEAKGDG